jgi:hypothetical protein
VEELEVAEDVGFDFGGLGFGVELLEFSDDLVDGVLAVAALNYFEAGAVEAQGAFGHQQDLLIVVLAQADAGGEAGAGIEIGGGSHSVCPWSGARTS